MKNKVFPYSDEDDSSNNAGTHRTDYQQEPKFSLPVDPPFKYLEIWQRVRIKLKNHLVFSRLLKRSRDLVERSLIMSKSDITLTPELPTGIFHPESSFKSYWNIIVSISLLYTAIIMPFSIAFTESNGLGPIDYFDLIIDFIYLLDFSLTCCTAYYGPTGELIVSRPQIILAYLKSWMVIDFFSSLPYTLFDLYVSGSSSKNANKFVRFFRLPRLYKLMRLSRLLKMLNSSTKSAFLLKIQDFLSIRNSVSRFLKGILTVTIAVHVFSCMWYFSAKIENFSPDTWVVRYNYQDSDTQTLYITCLYWAFTTLSTVGYGDISAFTVGEKIFSIIWMFCGCYFLGFIIGSLASMLVNIETTESALADKLFMIDEFIADAKLDKALSRKLKHAVKYSAQITGYSWLDKENILNEFPKQLKYEVSLAMHHGAAKNLEFFRGKDLSIVSAIVPFLTPLFTIAREMVYNSGEFANEMYFIVKGKVDYVYQSEVIVDRVNKGDYFGDFEMILEVHRKYAALAVCNLELLSMNRKLLTKIKNRFRCIWEEMKMTAVERERRNLVNQERMLNRSKKTILRTAFFNPYIYKSGARSDEIYDKMLLLSDYALGLEKKLEEINKCLNCPVNRFRQRSQSLDDRQLIKPLDY